MVHRSREQKLIDLCFLMCVTLQVQKDGWLKTATREDVAEWVAQILEQCGFPTEPCGSSWGVLKEKTKNEKLETIREALEEAALAIYEAGTTE